MLCWSHPPGPGIALIVGGTTYYVGLALLSIVAIMLLIHAYQVWQEIHEEVEPTAPSDLLESFEQAHAEGDLDDQELERLRQLLQRKE